MVAKPLAGKLSIYIQEKHRSARVRERLTKLGKKRDRSINYLVVEAILEYLDREERL
jgi:predicted transcriptional regulator